MITESTIYWITRLDNIRILCGMLLGLAAVVSIILIILLADISNKKAYSDEEKSKKKKDVRDCGTTLAFNLFFVLVIGLALVFIPTTKEMCAIKVIPAVSNSEIVQKIGAQASQIVEDAGKWMREQVGK